MENTTPTQTPIKSILPTTIPELIKAWDDGELITSLKFPTPTPSHEQSAQIALIHCIKENHGVPCEAFQWDSLCNLTIEKLGVRILPLEPNVKDAIKWLAFEISKAQSPKDAIEKVLSHMPDAKLQAVTRRFPFVLPPAKASN